jgi:uncharacterized membrane protein YdbT with pleckstrin-like domain
MYIMTLRPSQWINLGYILFGIFIAPYTYWLGMLIPIWRMIVTYCIKYEFYEDRIVYKRGVFNVKTNEIPMYRIKSIYLDEPLLYRLIDVGNVNLKTSDPYLGELKMVAVPVGSDFVNLLRDIVEDSRKSNGVKEFDMYSL